MQSTIDEARQLDKTDSFKPLTHLFDMPLDKQGKQAVYLNGNSLGPKPKSADDELQLECADWGKLGVRGHFDRHHPWMPYHELVTKSLARLIGAKPEEVTAMGTLTANLHFAFISFYRPTPSRYKIIRLRGFPSDTYAIASQVQQRFDAIHQFTGQQPFDVDNAIIEIKPDEHGYIDLDTFAKTIKEHGKNTAVIWIEAVHYLTGQFFDIAAIAKLAHEHGCKIGLDLAHAIGNVELNLNQWNIDFAAWCSYKYLSAGPGSIGGLYINEKYLADNDIIRFAGWWGHNKSTRFQMPNEFDPISTAESWQVSNPGILLLAALRQSLAIFDQVNLAKLREKNQRLVAHLETLLNRELSSLVHIITPNNPRERGCQLSLRLTSTTQSNIEEKLFDHGVICDVRGELIRVAPMGLYTTFTDVFTFVEQLKSCVS